MVLGTGGTVAGRLDPSLPVEGAYRAGQLPLQVLIDDLMATSSSQPWPKVDVDQVDQIDSKDMSVDLWRRLNARVAHHLARPEVTGVVIAHGTDTLEETAIVLDRVFNPRKPVVLVGAMRPADAPDADGPANLRDALDVARDPHARGVLATMAGQVYLGREVRKNHPSAFAALTAGDAGPVGALAAGRVAWARDIPAAVGTGATYPSPALQRPWPRVEVVTSHAEADGRLVDLLVADGVQGLIVAGTGNATVHAGILAALERARSRGVTVRRCTRITASGIAAAELAADPEATALTAAQARVDLQLMLLQQSAT